MVIRTMMVLLEMLALHRTHMMMMMLMLPTRRRVHILKLIGLSEGPIQVLQRKQILRRNMMMRVLSLDDLLSMVVGRQVPLEWEVCVALGEM
jgi:hypothetical protein